LINRHPRGAFVASKIVFHVCPAVRLARRRTRS